MVSIILDEGYTNLVIEHFAFPQNVGTLKDANGVGKYGDPACGDLLIIYIKVKKDIIEDIKFLVYGCAGVIATSSMTTVLAKGKTLEEAKKLTKDDVVEALGGLPENKRHCSVLGVNALNNAIEDYYRCAIGHGHGDGKDR